MSTPSIAEIEEEIVEEFSLFDDWFDKYSHIIELGQELPDLAEEYKTEDHIVRGCQSQVWLRAFLDEKRVIFQADSDAMITKGLIAMLVRVLSNHTPDEIIQTNLGFIDQIGVREHLSMNRSNGLNAMVKQMKLYAVAFKAQQEVH